jgi:ribosomal protein S18 acetylase RimI-like enzyme
MGENHKSTGADRTFADEGVIALPRIRKADLSDARQLAAVAEATFREAFGAVNTPEDMDLHCRRRFSEIVQGEEILNPNMMTLLCEENDAPIGFAQLRWERPPGCVVAEAPGEIMRLYVASRWHGKGVAQELMSACIEDIRHHGSDVVWLGVWERNPRAISFYRKFGFAEVGAHTYLLGNDLQRDLVMARATAPCEDSARSALYSAPRNQED